MIKKLLVFLLLSGVAITTQAQYSSIWQMSNYAGIREAQFNPSSIADSRLAWQVHLASFNWEGTNTALSNQYTPLSAITLDYSNKNYQTLYSDWASLGAMVQFSNTHALMVGTRLRTWQSENPLLKSFFEVPLTANNSFSEIYSTTSIRDICIGYALPVINHTKHFLKIGGAVKSYQTINNERYEFNSDANIIGLFGQTLHNGNASFSIADILGGGSGTGFDIGFTYEYRPNYERFQYRMDGMQRADVTQNKYSFKLGVSLLDLGGYTSTSGASFYKGNIQRNTLTKTMFDKASFNQALTLFNPKSIDSTGAIGYQLPTTLLVQLETQLAKSWYLSLLYRGFVGTSDNRYNQPSVISLAPRTEANGGVWSMPISFNTTTKKVGIGIHIKLGAFYFGMDNINFLVDQSVSPNFYAGISISKRSRRISDKDNDGVSDKKDKCADEKGIWEFEGCPDFDGDGIVDAFDKCRTKKGPKSTNGCPDRDEDGVEDDADQCPDEKGTIHGCPDTDNDGIPDKDDDCDTEKGSEETNGCPDTDNDGIPDKDDDCDTEPGPKENRGCPIK